MMLLWISGKNWSIYPFIPVIITLVVRLIFFRLAKNLTARAYDELASGGIPEGNPRHTAIYIGRGYALISGVYIGLLPVGAALVTTILSKSLLDPINVTAIYLIFVLITFLLIPLALSTQLDSLSRPFAEKLVSRTERLLKKVGFKSYGSFINFLLLIIITALLFYNAYLQLPAHTSQIGLASPPTPQSS